MSKPGKTRRGRRIVVGVSGSIAAYKACEIVRGLRTRGAEVRCVMTTNAARFVSDLFVFRIKTCGLIERQGCEIIKDAVVSYVLALW